MYFISTTIYLFLCISLSYPLSGPYFDEEPIDVQVVFSYQSANSKSHAITCRISFIESGQLLYWLKDGETIAKATELLSNRGHLIDYDRYNVYGIVETTYTTSALDIADITISSAVRDSGKYQCVLLPENSIEPVIASRVASLNIYERPETHDIECNLGGEVETGNITVTENEHRQLHCEASDTGIPKVNVWWTIESGTSSTDVTAANGNTAYYDWTPSRRDQHDMFVCMEYHPAFNHGNRSCVIGPVNVQYKPDVVITQSSYTMDDEDYNITLTCNVKANPPVQSISWKFNDKLIKIGTYFNVHGDKDQVLLISAAFLSDYKGQHIFSCQAVNSIGTGTNTTNVIFSLAVTASKAPKIIGVVIGLLLVVVTFVLLTCFLIKRQRVKEPSTQRGAVRNQNYYSKNPAKVDLQPGESYPQEDAALTENEDGTLYANANHSRMPTSQHRYNDSGYAIVSSQDQANGPQTKNVEGLTYADLDLPPERHGRGLEDPALHNTNDSITYAQIRL